MLKGEKKIFTYNYFDGTLQYRSMGPNILYIVGDYNLLSQITLDLPLPNNQPNTSSHFLYKFTGNFLDHCTELQKREL